MKILVLSHISELLGGAERSMLDVFDYWEEHYNIEPEFILREPIKSLAAELDKRGWKYHALHYTFWSDGNPPKTPQDKFHQIRQNSKAILAIEDIIQSIKPDLVMTNSIVCPWAALAAYYQQVPHVWFIREYGDLDHGRIFEIGREKTFEDVETMSSLVVTISQSLAKHITQYVNKDKVSILYNPFKIDEILQKTKEKVSSPYKDEDSLKLIISGNIAPSKGQKEAIEALGLLTREGYNLELCIVGKSGEPDYMKEIQSLIDTYAISSRIHFVGYQANLLAYVALADVGIMASRLEGFGRVTFEYLVAGKAIVGAQSGATPEMVIEAENGYLFDPKNARSLAEALRHYADNKQLVSPHGRASVKRAEILMKGPHNAEVLYEKVKDLVDSVPHPKKPLHIMHHWLGYSEVAQAYIHQNNSLKRVAKQAFRHRAKSVYVRLRSLKTKVSGK